MLDRYLTELKYVGQVPKTPEVLAELETLLHREAEGAEGILRVADGFVDLSAFDAEIRGAMQTEPADRFARVRKVVAAALTAAMVDRYSFSRDRSQSDGPDEMFGRMVEQSSQVLARFLSTT